MAIRDYVNSIKIQNNTYNVLNTALTGKTYVADYGNNYWTVEITTAPMTRENFFNTFTSVFDRDGTNNLTLDIPVLNNAAGTASGTITSTGSFLAGFTSITTTGGTGTLNAGDLIKFSNHNKVYQITDTVDLDGSTVDTIQFYPPLTTAITGSETIAYDSITFKVIPDDDEISYDTNVDGYFVFQQSFREVK